ncbi:MULTISPECIES: glycosylhydrolase-like jelly roll fold domain-containing protein [Streptomyces]|uniref:glycosylhydrolase-like jelly roll fold domain-containing protein n=1 Tax=Streptomyces TaxID=1883 RepID=UPI00240DACE0|nr:MULTISPECIES: glycosylhydrolase-like jelly roll fold domain-containing protein [Streptomyces]WFB81955.1 twin-arginine translocation signal domain-containing protein [Streptomyces olivaceus]WGK44289.1 twin-arginine translocation signal domain-containing protein [Streptomyces sp. B146]
MPENPLSRRRFVAAAGATGALAAVGLPEAAHAAVPHAGANRPEPDGWSARHFADPRHDSRPTVYWYWNGPVTPELVDRQLADLRSKGMYEVILFSFDNAEMTPVFFTEEWFGIVGHVLRTAERTGMRVWLFNDDHFPSGRAGEFVVKGGQVGSRTYAPRPELRLKALARSTTVVRGPASIDLRRSTGVGTEAGRLVADAALLGGAAVLRDSTGWGDCTVTGSAKAEHGAAGLVVRASADGRAGYAVAFDQTGVVTVERLTAGADPAELLRSTRTDGFNKTKFHTLRVTVRADALSVALDGKDKGTLEDTAHRTGGAGVRSVGDQRAVWESLTVETPDGAPLYTGAFDRPDAPGDFPERVLPDGDFTVAAAAARPAGSADAAEVVDLTGRLTGGHTWQVPAGRWQVDLFGGVLLADDSQGYSRSYVDLLDDEPVELYLDIVPGEYHRRFGRYFGTVVPGFWDDEPFYASAEAHFRRLPWSPTLDGALRTVGVAPGIAYSAAFDDLGRPGRIARGNYWQAVSNRFATAFRKQAQWYEKRGVALITNPLYDETAPAKRIASTGDLHKVNQWAQVPGGDIITAEYTAGEPTMIPRNPVSVAHQMGRERALLEMFGNMGWQVTPGFVHATVGAQAARGVNLTVLHALWTDESRVYFPPPFGPRAPWWWAMRPLAEWIGRVMEAGRGTSAARTALLQPQRAAEQWTGTDREQEVDAPFTEAAYALERGQVDFDLLHEGALTGDPALLAHAEVRKGRLVVGAAAYDLVVVPPSPVLDASGVRVLREFVRAGGTVIAVGALDTEEADGGDRTLAHGLADLFGDRVPARRPLGRGHAVRVADTGALGTAAADAGAAAAVLDPARDAVRVLRVRRGPDTVFLINNESGAPVSTVAALPATGLPELWDPATGEGGPAPLYRATRDGVRVPLDLEPHRTAVVVVRPGRRARPHLTESSLPVLSVERRGNALGATVEASEPGTHRLVGSDGGHRYHGTVRIDDTLAPLPLDGDWTLTLEREGATPVTAPLGSWTEHDELFSGSGTYTTGLDVDAARLHGRRVLLDLGDVRDVAEVSVNGTALPPLLWAPFVADVTGHLGAGHNTLRVKVANTLSNERKKPLPSGLLGPVLLRFRRRTTVELHRA